MVTLVEVYKPIIKENTLNDDLFRACLDKDVSGKSWSELAEEFNYGDKEKLRGAFRREEKRRANITSSGFSDSDVTNVNSEQTEYTETDNNIHIVCSSKRILSKDDIIKEFNIDVNQWKIQSFTVKTSEGYRKDRSVKWQVQDGVVVTGDVNDSGKMLIVPMYHVKMVLARKNENDINFEDVDKFFEKYESKNIAKSVKPKGYSEKGYVLEIDLADLHIGNIGFDIYKDSRKVYDNVENIINDIIARIDVQISKILLVNMGDTAHFDTKGRTTTSMSHTVTYDGSTNAEIFDESTRVMIMAIDKLREIAPVEMIGVMGNHDNVFSYMLYKSLEFYYRNDKNVKIDCGHMPRKFRKFGNNLVMWAHGDMNKNNLKSLLQREARKEFGETRFAEIHCGNYHHQQTIEADGVIIRYLPSITATDEWHVDNGWVGAGRSVISFLWDLDTGLREMWFSGV